jgi:hypothetical protein
MNPEKYVVAILVRSQQGEAAQRKSQNPLALVNGLFLFKTAQASLARD